MNFLMEYLLQHFRNRKSSNEKSDWIHQSDFFHVTLKTVTA